MPRDLLVSIEQITAQRSSVGREYYSFWIRLNFGTKYLSLSGWKYFPDKGTLTSPSQGKGNGKFIKTAKMNAEFYNEVQELARATFGVSADQPLAA